MITKAKNIHANWPPFISKCLAIYIYIYGRGFCLVTGSTRHARIWIHIRNWTRVHILAYPIKLVTGHIYIYIYIYILHKSNYSYEDYIWNGESRGREERQGKSADRY